MITGIQATGFRSLIDFDIALKAGLNVVVGPNGSGKTNFISLLDFCSIYVSDDLNMALSHCGGSSSVFSKEIGNKSKKDITISFAGVVDPNLSSSNSYRGRDGWDAKHVISAYNFEVVVRYDAKNGRIFVSRETLTFLIGTAKKTIVRTTNFDEESPRHAVKFSPSNSKPWQDFRATFLKYFGRRDESQSPEDVMASIIDENRSVLQIFVRMSSQMESVISDISSLTSVNIDPSEAGRDCPVSNFSSVTRTGAGLAALLYNLQQNKHRNRNMFVYGPRLAPGKEIFKEISSWASEINPDIDRILVELSPEDILLKPKLYFTSNPKIPFSFSRLSDGTVKWIALSTLILSGSTYNVIEEPENFLHPHMQEKFISLIRSTLNRHRRRIVIVTTHSETLLNMCEPDEIIVFSTVQGRTQSKKPSNLEEIEELVKSSGFSLGYFYRIGALDVH